MAANSPWYRRGRQGDPCQTASFPAKPRPDRRISTHSTRIGRAFRSSGPPTEPRQRTRPSHLELGLQLLALEPGGDGHDVLHPRRLVPCSTPTWSPPLDQRPTPPGNRDTGRGDPSLPERSGLVRRKAPAAEESGAARAAEAAGAAGVDAAAARRRAGARVWTRRHMVVGGAGPGSLSRRRRRRRKWRWARCDLTR